MTNKALKIFEPGEQKKNFRLSSLTPLLGFSLTFCSEQYNCYYSLSNKKKRSNYLVLGPGAQRTFLLSNRKQQILFNVLTKIIKNTRN